MATAALGLGPQAADLHGRPELGNGCSTTSHVRANPRVGAISRPGTDGTTALPCRGGPVRPRSAAHPCAAPRRSNVRRSNTGTCSDGIHRTLAQDAITLPSTTHVPALRSTVYRSAPQRPPLRRTRHKHLSGAAAAADSELESDLQAPNGARSA